MYEAFADDDGGPRLVLLETSGDARARVRVGTRGLARAAGDDGAAAEAPISRTGRDGAYLHYQWGELPKPTG